MARKRKKSYQKQHNDPVVTTKRWLRKHIMPAVYFWAAFLRLDAFVNEISVYIADINDKELEKDDGAQIQIDSSRRTADVRIKRNAIALFKDDYKYENYSPEDIVEMTVIHELIHIFTHPMSEWAFNTIGSMRNSKVLEKLFTKEEEVCVEHLTRVLFSWKEYLKYEPDKFKGKIVYLSKDPYEEGDKES